MLKPLFLVFLSVTTSRFVYGEIPEYKKPEILARACGPDYYNLPPMTFLSSTTADINNQGDVAFKVMSLNAEPIQGLWVNGKIVFKAKEGQTITDPALNDRGQVVVSVLEENASEGLYVYDKNQDSMTHVIQNQNTDIMFHSFQQILDNGDLYYRVTDSNDDRSVYSYSGGFTKLFSEGENTLGFKASYIFGPVVNNQREVATKIRLGKKKDWGAEFPDQIVLVKSDGSFRLIAEDHKSNPASPYKSFDNTVSLSENGFVAFIAQTSAGPKTLVIDKGGSQERVATEGQDGISEFEVFSPQVNTQGLVVFRAKNNKGLRGIYVADKSGVRRLIGENDEIPTDIGMGRIYSHPMYPGFGGKAKINDHNEIVFYALVVNAVGGQEWGSGVFKMSPVKN